LLVVRRGVFGEVPENVRTEVSREQPEPCWTGPLRVNVLRLPEDLVVQFQMRRPGMLLRRENLTRCII
jgi:hypothetical protein